MKKITLTTPRLLTASLASIIALNSGCGKTNSQPGAQSDAPTGTNNSSTTSAIAAVNDSKGLASQEITNAPAAATTAPTTPATPDLAPTAPAASKKNLQAGTKTVEMHSTVPAAPKNFYSEDFSTNHSSLLDSRSDYYFSARAGYAHASYGNDRDSWYAGIKFYANPTQLRERVGRPGWIIVPEVSAEFSHQVLARPDKATNPGAGDGVQLRTELYWPWVNWTTKVLARENCACAFAKPLHFTFGPVFVTGFDKTFEGSGFRFARYGGARLAVNRYAFVEYTFGKTDGFTHARQEFLGELPFYISRNEQVRYVLRGEWIRSERNRDDYFQIGAFVEMPLGLLFRPREWHSLIPFTD